MSTQPEQLGRYRLVETLGRGGMAVVYRGEDDELRRPVAIKVLADNLAADDTFRKRFLREAKLAARVGHPNIAHVYDSGEAGGRPYIVMEYVEGETLADLIRRRGKLDPPEAVELALQACDGLEHAHVSGLVHRDVKPQNLLVREDGTVKIVDFGIARSQHGTRLTEVGSVLGTAAYLAPEQAAGEEVTPATDVYALGVVLYELLTGKTPYTYETLTQLLVGQQDQPVQPVRELSPDVPPALEDVVMRCLARLPQYRPPSAAALAEQLRFALGDQTAPTRVAPAPPRWQTPLRRVWLVAAGVALAVFLVVFLALRAGDGGGNPPPARAPLPSSPADQARELSDWLRGHSR